MKTKLTLLLSVVLSGLAADFVNLTFDQPNLSGSLTPIYPGFPEGPFRGDTADLLPGWTVLVSQAPLPAMTYSPPGISPDGHLSLEEYTLGTARPELGRFGIYYESSPPNQVSLALKQTGTIPANTATLGLFANGLLEVRINGDAIFLLNPDGPTFYPQIDVSRFAGQTVDLELRVLQGPFQTVGMGIDILGFQPIPEPSTWALFGVGALAVGWFCRRRK